MSIRASDSDRYYRAFFDGALDAVVGIDEHGHVDEWNRRAEETFGWTEVEVVGRPLSSFLVPERHRQAFLERLAASPDQVHSHTFPQRVEMTALRRDGREFPVELSVSLVTDGESRRYIVFLRDLSEIKRNERRLTQQALEARLLHQITMLTATAESFEEALENCLRIMCQMTGWPIGHAWLSDAASGRLISSNIWFCEPDSAAAPLQAVTRDMRLGRGEELPGRIWASGEPAWVADVRQEPMFLARHGHDLVVRGAFGFPVFVHDEIVAVLEFFSPNEVVPDPQLLLIVGTVGTQLGRVIERRRWEEERGRLAAIVDSSSDAIIGKSLGGVIISWNDGAQQMYGYSASEAIGKSASLLLPDGYEAEEPEIAEAVRTGQRLTQFETIRRRRDGVLVEVSLTVSPIKDAGGGVVGVATIERDIRQLKAAQRELQDREARIRLLLDSTGQAMYGVDSEGNCTFCNRACVELLGYQTDTELLGRNVHVMFHHSRRDGTPYPIEECSIFHSFRTGESTHSSDEVFWRADGTSVPVEFWSSPIYRSGRLEGAVVVFDDMTGQRRAEQERTRLANIVDSSYDAIIGRALDGTIVSWNRGAEQVYGYTAEEAVGQSIDIILPPNARDEGLDIAGVLTQGHSLQQFESMRRRKDGALIDVSITVSPTFDADGCVIGTSTIERDVTQRKQRELELRHAKEAAEAANRAKSEFLANISHELRTPMNAIVGMVELALGEELSPLIRDYLETARESTQILLSLLNDLLDFSRMEAGRFEIEPEPFNLRHTLDEAMRALSLRAHEQGLELACHVQPDVPDRLEGDARRLRQIVINLAGNGIKFTEQGEVVVEVGVESRQDDIVVLKIEVRDTGIGIAPADRERIFSPFTQVDASTTRQYSGSGLGLAICRELTHKMGGRIWLESQVGTGTTFFCTLAMRELASEAVEPEEVRELQGLPVLVVDDNAINRQILEEALTSWHMDPTSAPDGRTALELARRAGDAGHAFPLVLVDALMPDMDGLTLIETLNARRSAGSATVLMVSSADRHAFVERCDELEIGAFLEKPISHSMLLDAVMTALKGPPAAQKAVDSVQRGNRSLALLVAEDTPANQKVVRAILEKRGHQVAVAANGREAIEMLQQRPFDAILMDVQMPTMDGLQATQAIRASANARIAKTPIVAMTAHAMKGDRDRCLRAGMDAYISKPIDAERLIRIVEKLARKKMRGEDAHRHSRKDRDMSVHVRPTRSSSSTVAVLDLDRALKRLGGDRDLLRDMAQFFLEDSAGLLDDLQEGLRAGDTEAVTRTAHSLKGLAVNFGAAAASEAARQVEESGRADDVAAAGEWFPSLEGEIQILCDALKTEVLGLPRGE